MAKRWLLLMVAAAAALSAALAVALRPAASLFERPASGLAEVRRAEAGPTRPGDGPIVVRMSVPGYDLSNAVDAAGLRPGGLDPVVMPTRATDIAVRWLWTIERIEGIGRWSELERMDTVPEVRAASGPRDGVTTFKVTVPAPSHFGERRPRTGTYRATLRVQPTAPVGVMTPLDDEGWLTVDTFDYEVPPS